MGLEAGEGRRVVVACVVVQQADAIVRREIRLAMAVIGIVAGELFAAVAFYLAPGFVVLADAAIIDQHGN